MRKMTLLALLVLAAIPAVALAAKPPHPSTPASTNATSGKANGSSAKVLFVLRGTITAYTAGTSVSIMVSGANHESSALKTAGTLSFPLNSNTKVTGTVTLNDKGIVKLRAPKNASATTLQTLDASQLIDQHATA